ncbi:MAG: 3-dehydroquinate synthase [Anaerolineales bacterium]|uniref:3-dehydroquinate synthase n=1 Tax=Candidatus Villigracilis proximus TaxID=3140683 RepID=UPI0031375F48|nr:3-dehydroquinate synthase [Anaerolineales bacterium]
MTHIFLYGPPGTGKSTLGKKLAGSLKLPFVDIDRVIETNADDTIPHIMEKQGEPVFRDLETAALKNLSNEKECVVALGGGALLRDENRAFAEANGKVVLLMAELPTLLERLHHDDGKRPLLAGDLSAKLTTLLTKRADHYNSFPMLIHVDGKTADQNVHRVQVMLGRHHLSAMGEYDAIVQNNGLEQLGEMLKARGLLYPIIVTDENVAKFHAEKAVTALQRSGFEPKVLTVSAGEAYKTLETISQLWHGFLEAGLDRKSTVIALGGGVVGDMAGFAASTYMRGVAWVGVPTTLLSMVDASLGGKTGFDLPEGKNLIGAFYPPKLVLADPQLLGTLPEAELISGMAEVVKHGIISDPELFKLCLRGLDWVKNNLEEVVKRAMAVKIKVIEEDPYEKGIRAALNLGHTVGHAVELVSKFKLRHGESIAIGTVAEAKYAAQVGLAGVGLVDAVTESLKALGLPIQIPDEMPREEIIRAMRVDKKKNAKAIRFALPVEIGKVELVEVTDLESVLDDGR